MSTNDYDYGYLKDAILDICVNQPNKRINKELWIHGYDKRFKMSEKHMTSFRGNEAWIHIETPKGLKVFRIKVVNQKIAASSSVLAKGE